MKFDSAFDLSNCRVNPIEFSVQINDKEKQSLQPKFIEVLCYLAKHFPRIIPRDELIENIWGPDSVVGDKSLTNAIWHLRKSLSEVNEGNEVIETIRKAGYRLMVEPQWHPCETLQTKESSLTPIDANRSKEVLDKLTASTEFTEESQSNTSTKTHKKGLSKKQAKSLLSIVILIVALIAILMGYLLGKSSVHTATITQITKHPGSELFPSPSPDGRYVVYSQVSNNQPTNLFMKDTLQPQLPAKQLTFDTAIERLSVWSNDGKYLYFARIAKTSSRCKYIQLKVESRQEKVIADCPNRGGYFYLDISPDDKTLAIHGFNSDAEKSGIYFLDLTKKDGLLQRFSCKTGCDYKDRDMAFSPDGKYLAISRRFNRRYSENVYLIDLETKVSQQLTHKEEDIVGLTWVNNNKIIYAIRKAGVRSGFVLDISEGTTKPLNITGFSYPSYTKKGEKLFYQEREENDSIASLSLNTDIASSPFPIILSNFSHHSPDFNETNQRFVYVSNESGFYELWSANTQGEERKQLTQLKKNIQFPKWSHNGDSIAFLASSEDNINDNIYIYSLLTQKISALNTPFERHNRPSWTLDDKKIISAIYTGEFTDLFSITIADSVTERLTKDNARYGIMTSETKLLYSKINNGLWQVDLTNEHKKPTKVIDGKAFTRSYAWDYHDNGIYFNKELKDHHRIMFYDLTLGKTRPLLKLPLNSFNRENMINYIPGEDSIMFTKSSYPQANIKMLKNSPLLQ
jgi:Tol biopolymer transport system component/DNA-binding winged helix-turn-helix (wHTH) protein